jgi:hypothetical protein
VFLGLPNLNDVSLIDNVCIDESFHHRQEIEGMSDKITKKCGFDDPTGSKHADPQNKPESPPKTSKTWMVILIVALVVVVVGAGVYLKFFHVPGMRYV